MVPRLRGRAQRDRAFLGGKCNGSQAGHDSDNNVPFMGSVFLDDAGQPIDERASNVNYFSLEAIPAWEQEVLAREQKLASDWLAC